MPRNRLPMLLHCSLASPSTPWVRRDTTTLDRPGPLEANRPAVFCEIQGILQQTPMRGDRRRQPRSSEAKNA